MEFKYYFFLPLVMIFFMVFLRARYGFVVVAVAAAVTTIYAFYLSSWKTFHQVSLIRYFPVFLLGSLTAFTHQCLFMAYPHHPLLQKSSPAVTHIQGHLYFFTVIITVRCFVCGYRAPLSSNPHPESGKATKIYNELPRRKQRGINFVHLIQNRSKLRGIDPDRDLNNMLKYEICYNTRNRTEANKPFCIERLT